MGLLAWVGRYDRFTDHPDGYQPERHFPGLPRSRGGEIGKVNVGDLEQAHQAVWRQGLTVVMPRR